MDGTVEQHRAWTASAPGTAKPGSGWRGRANTLCVCMLNAIRNDSSLFLLKQAQQTSKTLTKYWLHFEFGKGNALVVSVYKYHSFIGAQNGDFSCVFSQHVVLVTMRNS